MRRPRTVLFPRQALALLMVGLAACSSSGKPPAAPEEDGGVTVQPDAAPPAPDARLPQDTAPDSASVLADARAAPPPGGDAAASADTSSTGGPLSGTVPIKVLGSSNETGTCWRAFLWQNLRAAGVTNFDFVGRTSTGPDCGVAGYDKDLEAMPGNVITAFTANDFAVRFKAHPPRIVLVHVGGADARMGIAPAKILAAFSLGVEQARAVEPKVIFFVAQHTPQQPMTGINELNAAIPGWAMGISTPESPVAAVDLFTGIVPATDLSDGTHLNPAGSQKVAQRFLDVLLPLFKP